MTSSTGRLEKRRRTCNQPPSSEEEVRTILLARALETLSPRVDAARARLLAAVRTERKLPVARNPCGDQFVPVGPPVSSRDVDCRRLSELAALRFASCSNLGLGSTERSKLERMGWNSGVLFYDDAEVVMRYSDPDDIADPTDETGVNTRSDSLLDSESPCGTNVAVSRGRRLPRACAQSGDGVWCMICGAIFASLGQARRHVGRVHVPEVREEDPEEESCASIPFSSDSNGASPPRRLSPSREIESKMLKADPAIKRIKVDTLKHGLKPSTSPDEIAGSVLDEPGPELSSSNA